LTKPTNSATPVLRAGCTEVLVTDILIKWIRKNNSDNTARSAS